MNKVKKVKKVIVVSIIGIILITLIFYFKQFIGIAVLNGNSDNGIKKSIAYLHRDFISSSEEIKIIDKFQYDDNKVIFFSSEELSGTAKFYKNDRGNYKIGFIETLDSKDIRKISKAF